jgi:hypothetical protein
VAQSEASGEYLLRDDIDDTAGTAMYALTSTADASTEHDPREAVPSIECAVRGIDRSVSSVNDLNSSSVLHTDPSVRTSARPALYAFRGNDQLDNPNAHPMSGLLLSQIRESLTSSRVDASEYFLPAASKRTASNVDLYSVADTAMRRASNTSRAGANDVIDFGSGWGAIKTLHMSAAAVAFHHQSVGDTSKPCGFHKLVPDSGNPAINLASVHAAGYDIYVSPRPLQQQHRSGSQSVGRDDTNKQCLPTPTMAVTVNPSVSISKSTLACPKQSSLV